MMQASAAAGASLAPGSSDETAKVKVLKKPRGDVGVGKKGYTLRYTMQLRGGKGRSARRWRIGATGRSSHTDMEDSGKGSRRI